MAKPNLSASAAHSGNFDPTLTLGGSLADPYFHNDLSIGNGRDQAGADPVSTNIDMAVRQLDEEIRTAEEADAVSLQFEEAALLISPTFRGLLDELRPDRGSEHDVAIPKEETSDVAMRLERQGFVRDAPLFAAQVKDTTRIAPFNYFEDGKRRAKIVGPKTEHEGLVELDGFLSLFENVSMQQGASLTPENAQLLEQAASIRENLTFIGDKELAEAAHGLGAAWRLYLDGNPDRRICILTEVSKLSKFQQRSTQKSDVFLRNKIMDTFTEEELEKYGPRIDFAVDDLESDPQNTRLIMLDDWTISGSQMRSAYEKLMADEKARKYIDAGSLEINVAAAPQNRIENGLEVNPYDDSEGTIKVRAYFKAHHAETAQTSGQAHITGLHCAVNYGFYHPLKDIKRELELAGISMNPALARVCQTYKHHKSSPKLPRNDVLNKMLPNLKGRDARQ